MKNRNKGIKLIESYYNRHCGESYACIQTPRGVFDAFSQLNIADKQNESKYIGCKCAEAKAKCKYINANINEVSAQIKALEDFYKNLKCSHRFDETSYVAKRLRKEIDIYKQERAELIKAKTTLRESVQQANEISLKVRKIVNK